MNSIFLYDNTEVKRLSAEVFSEHPTIIYHHDFKNEGIARRLNEACETALQHGFKWLLTMDQDSTVTQDALTKYISCFYHYGPKEMVAAFGPKYNRYENKNDSECVPIEVSGLITSGMLLNLESFKKIGPFDEALFIDAVDHDYCIRARLAGFSIIQFSNIDILHELGKMVRRSSFKSLYLFKKRKVVHPPLRCYYIFRNLLYLQNKFQGVDEAFLKFISDHAISRIKTSAFYGGSAWMVIRYLLRARKDFRLNRMGKIVNPLRS